MWCSILYVFSLWQHKEAFKKRWFVLDSGNRKLLYFKHQLVRGGQTLCVCVSLSRLGHLWLFNFIFSIWLNVGCRGIRGHFHWHGGERVLGEGVWTQECSKKQVEIWHHSGDPMPSVCLHVRAGERAERVDSGHCTSPSKTHDTTGLYQ